MRSERDYQDYQSYYLDLHASLRLAAEAEKESIIDDVVFEIELIKQVEVNVDYILLLVQQWREARGNGSDIEMAARTNIQRAIDSSITLRNKRDLILAFVDSVNVSADTGADWRRFVERRKTEELDDHRLRRPKARGDPRLRRQRLPRRRHPHHRHRNHQDPATSLAIRGRQQPRAKKQTVLDKLAAFFDRFFGLG